ncbi:transporter [Halorubrum sp. GN11_10-6_MGM]|uniref:oligosaccharide flippase family protein n=1 Tax=Halorubrum sp. GN11_10-6_MGM TaxID=2518112 RepID=UPI0010F89013|nr:oligosaccharide flippase family protein [Halorubrum sp. GN11_10-6_MGM]TKX72882.1 transporter [Halorubrum sp. GN11_10-6_MGM]
MKLGQQSFVTFASKFGSSLLSFLSIVYFSRILGPDALGIYFVVLAMLGWFNIVSGLTVKEALTKRLSEMETNSGGLLSAAVLIQICLLSVTVVGIVYFKDYIDTYIGIEATYLLILMLVVQSVLYLERGVLEGIGKVHVSGLLAPTSLVFERGAQLVGVALGLGVIALLGGYVVGVGITLIVGLIYISLSPRIPERHHFTSLVEYGKYNWVNAAEGRTLNNVDTLTLGYFVSSTFVGFYGVAWNVSSLLALFGYAISQTLFPEISRRDSEKSDVGSLITDSLTYTGLLLIPGLVGGILIGERILEMYGDAYVEAKTVLIILITARLIYNYHTQLSNSLNALDRPDVVFNINLKFISFNIILNIGLVYVLGWTGAAIATVSSSLLALLLSYRATARLVDFQIPYRELLKQSVSAGLMAFVILALQPVFSGTSVLFYRFVDTVVMVGVGAGVYFASLFWLSGDFRRKVIANVPI